MTKLGNTRHLSALLLFSLLLFTPLTLNAQIRPIAMNSGSDMTFVQAPAWSSMNQNNLQPVISPAQIPTGQLGLVTHLWPRLVSYTMETVGKKPYIQTDLSMGVQYNYSFHFDLNARTGMGKAMAIPEGWYQLQIVVIRKSQEDVVSAKEENPYDRYVTSTSTFIQVDSGSFEQILSLRFPELEDTALMHHLYVELIPLREECVRDTANGETKYPCIQLTPQGKPDTLRSDLESRPDVKTYLIEMPFLPHAAIPGKMRKADDLAAQDVPFKDLSLSLYVARAKAYKARVRARKIKVVNAKQYAVDHNIALQSTEDAIFSKEKDLLERLMKANAIGNIKPDSSFGPLYAKLCEELAARNQQRKEMRRLYPAMAGAQEKALVSQLKRCALNPENYLRLTRVVHVGRPVISEVKRIFQKPLIYTIMANYMSNRSSSIDSISGTTVKLPQIPFISAFLEKIPLTASHTVNYANTRSRAETGIASMSDSLDFNYHAMRIPVTDSQVCLDVRAVNGLPSTLYDFSKNAQNGFYICAPVSSEKIIVNEIYAHAFERCKETSSIDCDSLTQSINIPMRGDREISQFFYEVRKGVVPDHNNLVVPFGDMSAAARYFNNTPVSGQMQVINPVEFPHDPIPSYWERISFQYKENFKE